MIARRSDRRSLPLGDSRARGRRTAALPMLAATVLVLARSAAGGAVPDILPDPDGKPGASNKPVKVYFLSGQSNMCGMGRPDSLKPLATGDAKFGYLVDDNGAWTERKDVFYLYSLMGTKLHAKGWLSATVNGRTMGPEVGIGHVLGEYHDEMVLLIKACCGNRSLAWDVASPTSRKRMGQPQTGDGWYCGTCYDKWTKAVNDFLADLKGSFPAYQGQGYEVAGFFWWQGHKDKGKSKQEYGLLLAELIQDWRKEFKAPDAPFVVATVAFSGQNLGAWKGVWEGQMAVGDPRQYPQFAGNVASVDIRDIGGGGFHYGSNGATYAKVGDRMGRAMAELLHRVDAKKEKEKKKAEEKKAAVKAKPKPSASAKEAAKLLKTAREAERMRQRPIARVFYKKVIKDYPDTPAAKEAKRRLERLE